MDTADASPTDLEAQVRAIAAVDRLPESTEQSRAYWAPRITLAVDRVEQLADSCKTMRLVALQRAATLSHEGDEGVKRVWRTLDKKGCVDPSDFNVASYGLVRAHKNLGACKDLVAMATAAWPRASAGDQSGIIGTVAACSTEADREANLAFVPSERMQQYRAEFARLDRRVQAENARQRSAEALREAQRELAASCLASCRRLQDVCVRACSGTGCTTCGRSHQACVDGCPAH
jgi:hypothetical protein